MIADASLAIETLEEEIRRENDRRYAFRRMLDATDRVLWWLEALNLREQRVLPPGLGERIRKRLDELPESCRAHLCGGSVQQVMDGIYDVQEALLRLHVPAREIEDDSEADIEDEKIIAAVDAVPEGLTPNGLAYRFPPHVQAHVRRRAVELAEAGRIRLVVRKGRGPGAPKRRYFAAGAKAGA